MSMSTPHENIFVQIPNFVFCKNLESKYLTCNHNFARAVGIGLPNEVFGKTDFNMPWADTHAELYRQGDQEVLDTEPKHNHIETQLKSNGEIISIIINKAPLLDHAGEKIGVVGSYMEMMPEEYCGKPEPNKINIPITRQEADFLYYLSQGMTIRQIASFKEITLIDADYRMEIIKAKLKCKNHKELLAKTMSLDFIRNRFRGAITKPAMMLTRREEEIVQYLMRGKTSKGIAVLLNLSHRTVENNIAALKTKIGASSKSELIEKIIANNLSNQEEIDF